MKKYLISTLTAAAAMAVPAFADATLIGSWDFSEASQAQTSVTSIQSDVAYSDGSYLYITSAGDSIVAATTEKNGYLSISPSSSNKTVVDISSQDITLNEGISVVLTIEGWSSGSSNSGLFASIETSSSNYAAGIGETGTDTGVRDAYFTADGSSSGKFQSTSQSTTYTITYPATVVMTFIGDTLTLYEYVNDTFTLIATATMTSAAYSSIGGADGTITEVALGSWDYQSTNDSFSSLNVSSVEIWKGDVTTLPEPSMFGLFFGLGAIGLVATRRRKRA